MGHSLSSGTSPRNLPRRDEVCRQLSRRLDITDESAHQVLYAGKLAPRVAAVIDSFSAAGEFDRLERWLAPIRAALQGASEVDLTDDLIIRSQRADLLEDIAETEYLANPNSITRRSWLQKLREQQAVGLQLQTALIRKERTDA